MKRVLHIAWTGLLLIALLPILPLVALMWGFSWYEASHSKTSVTALRVATWVMPCKRYCARVACVAASLHNRT